jgi:chorismate mutase / prephenate dehydratase
MENRINAPKDKTDPRLDKLRDAVNEIDASILGLINQRLTLAKKIGEIKKAIGDLIYDKSREDEILSRLYRLNPGPLRSRELYHIFIDIIGACREIQRPTRITYLGPQATFTHIAAMALFGHSADFIPQPGIRDIFVEVSKGTCDYGVVPVENSIEGAVNHTLDLFFESDLKICAEKYITIHHALLSKADRMEEIQTIYSHPQAFAQCRSWIRKNLPGARLSECSSTAHAAQKAFREKNAAAIAGSEAAHIHGLKIIASSIEDYTKNVTRFLVIGKEDVGPTDRDKTSIMFVTAHVPGALYKALEPIASAGVNMLKLESRPAKYEDWHYFFFVDVEGHIQDAKIKKTIDAMKRFCPYLKWLGSYPMTQE